MGKRLGDIVGRCPYVRMPNARGCIARRASGKGIGGIGHT